MVSYELRGEPYQITGAAWSNPPAYAVGDPVQVSTRPISRAARIYSWFDFWFLPVLLGGLGLMFALVGGGVGLHVVAKRKLTSNRHGLHLKHREQPSGKLDSAL